MHFAPRLVSDAPPRRRHLLALALATQLCLTPAPSHATTPIHGALIAADWNSVLTLPMPDVPPSVVSLLRAHALLALNRANDSLCLFALPTTPSDGREWDQWTAEFLSHAPQSGVAHYLRADAFVRIGDYEAAEQALAFALNDSRMRALAYGARGTLYTLLHDYDSAWRDFSLAADIAPDRTDSQTNLASLAIISREAILGSEAHFRQALALNPDDALSLNGLGIVLAQKGQFEEARKLFESAGGQAPCLGVAALNLLSVARQQAESIRRDAILLESAAEPGTSLQVTATQAHTTADANLAKLNALYNEAALSRAGQLTFAATASVVTPIVSAVFGSHAGAATAILMKTGETALGSAANDLERAWGKLDRVQSETLYRAVILNSQTSSTVRQNLVRKFGTASPTLEQFTGQFTSSPYPSARGVISKPRILILDRGEVDFDTWFCRMYRAH